MARTTGVYPTLIDFEGINHQQTRKIPARIDELVRFIAAAYKKNAEAVVVECMALDPFLQEITQQKIIQSQIGVITNVRLDHTDVMGKTKEAIAKSLSLTIPTDGLLFTAETEHYNLLESEAQSRNCKLVRVEQSELDLPSNFPVILIKENIILALAVCQHLGMDSETALEGMIQSSPDRGAFSIVPFHGTKGILYFANALAANDPESTQKLLQKVQELYSGTPLIGLYSHRNDRSWRLNSFKKFMKSSSFKNIYSSNQFRNNTELINQLVSLEPGSLIFAFGNYKKQGEMLIQEIEKRCCHKQ